MPLPSGADVEAAKEKHRYSVLIYIDTATPVRIWTGVGDFETSAGDDLDPSATYRGIGLIGAIPALKQMIGGTAERLDIALSGVDSLTQGFMDDSSDIRGSHLSIGITFFDADWQAVSKVAWLWTGTVDVVTSSYQQLKRTITLSVGSEFIDRSRGMFTMWSNAAHQGRHPGDRFFERTSINNPYPLKWPQ